MIVLIAGVSFIQGNSNALRIYILFYEETPSGSLTETEFKMKNK
jgi:hypothetical protein